MIRFLPETTSGKADASFAEDLLPGAEAIADFVYGDRKQRRKIYHLAETRQLPVFRLGNQVCARRSAILSWIAAQEAGCANSGPKAA